MKVIFSCMITALSTIAFASPHVARIVKIENDATVFIPNDKDSTTKSRLVRYLGKDYRLESAIKGMKLENGFVLTTGRMGKVKIVFNNGDHFYLAENTQYVLDWKKEHLKDEVPTTMTLLRGAVRGLIEKGGPRSGIKIVTNNSVMGVRGTDFHISHRSSGVTQISVLRGEIELKDPQNDQVKIEAGQTFLTTEDKSNLSSLTKTELKQIALNSTIHAPMPSEPELNILEEKAKTATLSDIKLYNPELYQNLKDKNFDSETLAQNTIQKLEVTAPEKKSKPKWVDLLDDSDPYKTYKQKND